MSHCVQPKQILKKEISSKEYNLLEEWAPQTLHGYCYSESSSTASTQPEKVPNTVHDPMHRRPKNRSSSLYEEWKAHATRNEQVQEAIPPVKKNEEQQATENVSPASDGAAGVVGDNVAGSEKKQDGVVAPLQPPGNKQPPVQSTQGNAASSRDTNNLTETRLVIVSNNRRAPNAPSEAKKAVVAQTASGSEVRPSNRPRNNTEPTSTNPPMVSSARRVPKVTSEPKKPVDNQPVARPEVGGYTAPNGTHLRKDELQKLSRGVKVPNKDTVYFLPSFLEDPWKGVKPIMTECSCRWW